MEERGASVGVVLDASVTLAWLFPEERTADVERMIDGMIQTEGFVPSLWRLEVANVLATVIRRGKLSLGSRDEYLAALRDWPVTVDTETDRRAWAGTLRLADREKLTVYDAAYLELADRMGLPLATLDRKLAGAALAVGVRLA